jgi:DNA-binding transcriptional MerR regulator
MSDEFSIGEVAWRAGINTSAIRYYERIGLLRLPRRVAKRRVYDASVFESLALVALAQDAGFRTAEIKLLLHGFERATPASQRWQALARGKLAEIAERIERAEQMRDLLERLLRCQCETLGQCVRRRVAAMPGARAAGH